MDVGSIIDDKYEIVGILGDGGMGRVYKAIEKGLNRAVAIKMLHSNMLIDTDSRLRFEQEGKILATLQHPNILRFYRFGLLNKKIPFIVMEVVDGQNLRDLLNQTERLVPSRAIKIAIQICDALAYAHENNIVHRDLKPTNVMLTESNNEQDVVRILDFGLAKVLEADSASRQRLTQTGELIGSVFYMSPEQCQGFKADHRSDIYALGCLIFECIAGRTPFSADNPIGLMHLHATEAPPQLKQAGIPQGLNVIVARTLHKDPDKRYQSMKQLKSDLELVLNGHADQISLISAEEPDSQSEAEAKSYKLIAFVACLLLIGVGALFFKQVNEVAVPARPAVLNREASPLGPKLPERKEIWERYPNLQERIDALKVWIARYGKRNAFDTANAYYTLYYDLASAQAPDSQLKDAAHNAIKFYRKVVELDSTPEDGFFPQYVLDAAFRASDIASGIHENEIGKQLLMRVINHKNLEDSKKLWSIYYGLARVAGERGNHEEEEYWHREYLRRWTFSATDARVALARILLNQGREAESKALIDEAIQNMQDVHASSAHIKISIVLLKQHRYEEALKFCKIAREESVRSSDDVELASAECEVLVGLNRFAEAQPAFMELWRNRKGREKWETLRQVFSNAKRAKLSVDAEALLTRQVADESSSPEENMDGFFKLMQNPADQDVHLQNVLIAKFLEYRKSLNPDEFAATLSKQLEVAGWLDQSLGRISEAEEIEKSVLEAAKLQPPERRTALEVEALTRLAVNARLAGRSEAEALADQAYEKALAAGHPFDTLNRLLVLKSSILQGNSQFAKAKLALDKIQLSNLTAKNKAAIFERYAKLAKSMNRPQEAAEWQAKADALKI